MKQYIESKIQNRLVVVGEMPTQAQFLLSQVKFLGGAIVLLAFSAALLHYFPRLLPFGLFSVWRLNGSLIAWLQAAWPLFAWGCGMTFLISMLTSNEPEENRNAEGLLVDHFVISVGAGVTEEICFRWALFCFCAILVIPVNYLFGGFLGCGLPELMQVHILGPIANWATLGYLHDVLANPQKWDLGAALISANTQFRNAHRYQGFFGWVNSWFVGMYLFYVMLTFGLPVAIAIHFLYDALIFLVRYLDEVIERAEGNV